MITVNLGAPANYITIATRPLVECNINWFSLNPSTNYLIDVAVMHNHESNSGLRINVKSFLV
jgi:hypothetical protein